MVDIVKLVEYNQHLRHEYLATLSDLPWEEVVKERGASFNSLRNIFLHCIAVFDFANRLIQDNDGTFPRLNYDEYDDMEKIQAYMNRVESKFNTYLRQITPIELSREIHRQYRDGTTVTSTVEEYLTHFVLEEIHHQGEFIALLWQIDVRPPHKGWIQYLYQ